MMQKSESIAELAKALSAFQGELRAAPKDSSNPFFRSHYADLATVWETCRGPLTKHGLAVSQLPSIEVDRITLDTLLMHTSGEWLASTLLLTPMREKKDVGWVASMDPQSVGSAITYARRYALSAILGVVADDDDDAEAAMGRHAEPSTARMPQAMAVAPKGLCSVHHVAFVRRQGTSKAGKPFDFWACPQKAGDGYCKERPPEDEAKHTGGAPAPVSPTSPSQEGKPLSSQPGAPPIPDTLGALLTWARDTHNQDSRAVLSALVMAGLRRADGQAAKSVTELVANTPEAVQAAYELLVTAWGKGEQVA